MSTTLHDLATRTAAALDTLAEVGRTIDALKESGILTDAEAADARNGVADAFRHTYPASERIGERLTPGGRLEVAVRDLVVGQTLLIPTLDGNLDLVETPSRIVAINKPANARRTVLTASGWVHTYRTRDLVTVSLA